jgi:hypothetical protein
MTSLDLTIDLIRANTASQIFITFDENTKFSATLSELKVGVAKNQEFRIPFSFILTIQVLTHIYPQAIYSIEWEGIGQFDIFLVPIGYSSQGIQYQAVFG